MRGKVPTFHPPSGAVGITPAYAGKRRLCVVAAHLGRDHPRVCGEKCAPTAQQNTATGSPPRMRGKAGQIQSQTPELGITPAYAGKSLRLCILSRLLQDHPRVCGEKAFVRSCCASRTGSPPRMRGKVCTYSATEHGYGITPAYAGKSRPDPEPDAGTGDHPRVCGEKSAPMYPVPPVTGSPPRMRGKEKREVDEKQPCGITPAYAGKR